MNKAKLIYLVKHNKLVKFLYVNIGSLFLKLLGLFLPIKENLVLMVPNTGASFSGSPKDIYDYLAAQPQYDKLKLVWAFNDPLKFKEQFDLDVVKLDSMQYFMTALRAQYWITDINVERGLKFKKKKTKFLNTWHGVAMKKIGNDDPKSASYDYSDISFLCVSGEHDKKVYASALLAPEESFLPVGMPRNDRLFRASKEECLKIRERLNIPLEKKVLLYVPTWRDSQDNGKTYGLSIDADFSNWEKCLGDEYVLLFRAHHRTTELMNISFNDFLRDYSSYPDLNDLLIIADVLITDYSSVIFDYSILKKPAFCYAYDYVDYIEERGFYVDPKEIFGVNLIRDESLLLNNLQHFNMEEEKAKTTQIFETYMNYSTGNATKACVESLFGR